MSREQLLKRYRELGEAQRAHEDQAAADARARARIVLDLYDRFHLSCAEIAAELGDVGAEEVSDWLLTLKVADWSP